MTGLGTIIKKELADHFSSYRFVILFALIGMVSLITTYMVGMGLRDELSGMAKPKFIFLLLFTASGPLFSLVQFVGFLGPLIGLILGFDAINRERGAGTLSKIVSQPIYRDAVINGKFLAGVATVAILLTAIVLVVTGLGLKMMGIVPGFEEILRIVIYLVISICYISFWLGISILYSILFRGVATSALAALATWIFFSFFISMGANIIASSVVPIDASNRQDVEAVMKHATVQRIVSLASPMQLYNDATGVIIDPLRKTTKSLILMGPIERLSSARFQRPLDLRQSLLIVIPHIITLIAITCICFALSYAVFMRQEIRSR